MRLLNVQQFHLLQMKQFQSYWAVEDPKIELSYLFQQLIYSSKHGHGCRLIEEDTKLIYYGWMHLML